MAKIYKLKAGDFKAIQFDGTNFDEISAMVGPRYADPSGTYEIPKFDIGDRWLPGSGVEAVVWMGVDGWYAPVNTGDWVVEIGETEGYKPVAESEFTRCYEEVVV